MACSVSHDERIEINKAVRAAGFPSVSEGIREILLAFARNIRVRYAVEAHREGTGPV